MRPTTPPPSPELYRAAADAVGALAICLRDCAAEVGTGSGAAREVKGGRRSAALEAIWAITDRLAMGSDERILLTEMAIGCREGYVLETWALRIIALGARDTEPMVATGTTSRADVAPLCLVSEEGRGG
jgi:hypothetical protein